MGSTPIVRFTTTTAVLRLAIVCHLLCFTSPTTTPPHPQDSTHLSERPGLSSAEAAAAALPQSSHNNRLHSRQGFEGIIGEQELSPEGDLASQFGLGQPGSSLFAFTMTSAVEPSHAAFSSTKPLPAFAIDYGHDVVAHDAQQREIALLFDERGGARWRTNVQFDHGTFSVKIKTPDGDTSGLSTTFYLSSLQGDESQDEIDFEFLGKDKRIVQTNFFTVGTGNREETHQLGFDSSAEFHDYTIRWLPSKIEWLIDGKLVRCAEKEDSEAYPVKPMYLYASIWKAGDIDGGRWAGSYSGAQEPYISKYRDVHVPVNKSGRTTKTS